MEDLRGQLGAGPPSGTLQVTLFVPSVDREGRSIDQEFWREGRQGEVGVVVGGSYCGITEFDEV